MKKANFLPVFCLSLLLGFAGVVRAAQPAQPTIWLAPDATPVNLGNPLTLSLWMDFSSDPTLGGSLTIFFDDSLLDFDSFSFTGSFDTSQEPTYVAPGQVQEVRFGTWSFGGLSGPMEVGVLTFDTVGMGEAIFSMEDAVTGFSSALSWEGQEVNYQDTSVNIVPEPGAISLFLLGGLGLAGLDRKLKISARRKTA